MKNSQKFYASLPNSPGVYLMKDAEGKILYIGKAANLRRRVKSYFERPHDARIEKMVGEIKSIACKKTDSSLEALMLESRLIKKFEPFYNIREKDDKSFLYAEITSEPFPRVLLVRGKELEEWKGKKKNNIFGPFTSAGELREALRILRKIFPWSNHAPETRLARPCFEREIGLCPGTCVGAVAREEYAKTVQNIKLFFRGKKKDVIRNLSGEMKRASDALEFEKAAKIKRQIFALEHIQDVALITEDKPAFAKDSAGKGQRIKDEGKRVEGYDISNISGTSAVGSMAVFLDGAPRKDEYRKFRIRTITQADDVGMIREVLSRRLKHAEWQLPELIVIDGGKPQVNAAKETLGERGLKIPIVGIAKGPERKKNEFLGAIPAWTDEKTLIKARNEAHRFAIAYHKKVRGRRGFA